MKNYCRALREAWRHWLTLSIGILCSFAMAFLWGANIIALFPVIETTIHGDTLQQWNIKRTEAVRDKVNTLAAEVEAVVLPPQTDEHYLSMRLKRDMLQTKLMAEQVNLQSRERLQPWLEAWLPTDPFNTVILVLVLVVAGTLLKQIFGMANVVLVNYVSQSIAREVRMRIFSKAVTMDRTGFNHLGISGFMAYITHTTDGLAQGITAFYGGLVAEPLRILSCLTLAMIVSWRVTLASMIFAPLMVVLMVWLNRRIRGLARQALDRSLGFHHVILEVFGALQTVQANTMEPYERERFRKSTKQMRRMGVLGSFYNALANPITEVFGMSALCTGLGVAAYLVISQKTHIFGIRMTVDPMSVTELTVVFGLLVGATEPLRKLSGVIGGINSGSAAANLLYPLLDAQSRIVDPPEATTISIPHRTIEFKNVTFSYDGIHEVLKNVNLTIPFGERLAVIGPNGGGKSTLMNLLCRFYDPQKGAVTMDGIPLCDLALNDIRSRIAIVSQQSDFFNETVLHNIRYGRWDATDAEVVEAAKKARADEFISEFSWGYYTNVGPNGQRLSGGQRQRIALARALLRNSEILILDEATNQIDVESEKLIHEALLLHAKDKTLIMITHRQSTLELATRIIQVDRGDVKDVTHTVNRAA
ncbi:ABC transporter ATP-binding protein [Schlesneria sp.]|uniref:ABC transporter ATP-binding protein n=1 Tax=Schlesneria sp. TaxID=2762018 RepID=UPI002EE36C07